MAEITYSKLDGLPLLDGMLYQMVTAYYRYADMRGLQRGLTTGISICFVCTCGKVEKKYRHALQISKIVASRNGALTVGKHLERVLYIFNRWILARTISNENLL